jgi:hypothetical protein
METGSRKRLRRSKDVDSVDSSEVLGNPASDAPNIIGIPPSLEARFATAVFELGLKQSSPKIIMVILSGANVIFLTRLMEIKPVYRIAAAHAGRYTSQHGAYQITPSKVQDPPTTLEGRIHGIFQ